MIDTDVFDKVMLLPILKVFYPIYHKQKEILLYLFFGFSSFFISITSFYLLHIQIHMNELIATLFSWFLSVSFAYLTNKLWVFKAKTKRIFGSELILFFKGRILSLIFEETCIFVFITKWNFSSMVVKCISSYIVIILNYLFSKFYVFRK